MQDRFKTEKDLTNRLNFESEKNIDTETEIISILDSLSEKSDS